MENLLNIKKSQNIMKMIVVIYESDLAKIPNILCKRLQVSM